MLGLQTIYFCCRVFCYVNIPLLFHSVVCGCSELFMRCAAINIIVYFCIYDKDLFIYLKKLQRKVRQRKVMRERVLAFAGSFPKWLGLGQETGVPSSSPTCVTVGQVLTPPFTDSPGTSVGSRMERRAAETAGGIVIWEASVASCG